MEGLNRQEVEYRENNGLSNEEKVKYTRTTKQIILSNTITLFNILNIVLIIIKNGFSISYLLLPFIFFILHCSYGIGTIVGIVKGFFMKRKKNR